MNIFSSLISFDLKTTEYIISLRGVFLNYFFFLITWLGSWQVILGLLILISFIFVSYKKKDLIFPLLISVLGSGIMVIIIKNLVKRSRPGADIALYVEQLASFPSSHAALILSLFGFLIYCSWRLHLRLNYKIGFIIKIIATLVFGSIILLVGFSRLYLGVHFLSDVLAGYLTGLLWLLIAIYISKEKF